MEERAVIAKQQLEHDKATSEKERKKLSEQLLLTIEEFHKLGINRNYAKLLENQLAIIEHHWRIHMAKKLNILEKKGRNSEEA